jgi:hypothetical protein
MVTGMITARSLVTGEWHDVSGVNATPEYDEEVRTPASPQASGRGV